MVLHWKRLFVAMVYTISFSGMAFAKNENTSTNLNKADLLKAELTASFEGYRSPVQPLILIAMGGAEKEALQNIYKDMQKRNAASVAGQMALKDNQVFFKGKATGVRITSYSPLNVEYKGQVWSYDKSQAADTNYFHLISVLEGKQQHGVSSLWLPSAYAQSNEQTVNGAILGTVLGGMAGILLGGVLSIVVPPLGIGMAYAGGVLVGANIGLVWAVVAGNKADKEYNALVDQLLKAPFLLACNKDKVILTSGVSNNASRIVIDKNSAGNPLEIDGKDGSKMDLGHVSPAQNQMLNLLRACNNSQDAETITQQLKLAEQKVASAIAPVAPSGKDSSGSVKTENVR